MGKEDIDYVDLGEKLASMDIPEEVLAQSGIGNVAKATEMLKERATDVKGALHIQGALAALGQSVNLGEVNG